MASTDHSSFFWFTFSLKSVWSGCSVEIFFQPKFSSRTDFSIWSISPLWNTINFRLGMSKSKFAILEIPSNLIRMKFSSEGQSILAISNIVLFTRFFSTNYNNIVFYRMLPNKACLKIAVARIDSRKNRMNVSVRLSRVSGILVLSVLFPVVWKEFVEFFMVDRLCSV